jgi:hypothetical protein
MRTFFGSDPRLSVKRFISALLICAYLSCGIQPVFAISSGSACKTRGEVAATLVCVQENKKLIWRKLETFDQVQAVIDNSLKLSILPKRLTPVLSKVRSDKSFWLDQECAVDFPDVKVPECIAGDALGKKIMVVYGDSHASMWMTALDYIAKNSGYKIYLFAKLACPLVEVPIWSYQLNKPFNECTEWQEQVLPKIESLKPDVMVVTDQWKPAVVDGKKSDFDTATLWANEFPKAVSKLNSFTKRLIVLSNNPSMQQDSVACASKPRANIALCAAGRSQAGNVQINRIEADATKNVGATFIDTVNLACNQYLCPIVIGDKFVYFDQWHFTATYVTWLTPVLKKAMNL